MQFGLGQSVPRREDPRLLRGEGRYVDDITLPHQLHAYVLRSQVAHGRLISINFGEVAAAPGVCAIYTHAEIAGRLAEMGCDFPMEPAPAPVKMPHLAEGKVRFAGQPIALVVAESRAAAQDAAERIEVEIEDLPAVTHPPSALEGGASELHAEAPGNLAYTWECGDAQAVDALFRDAAHIVTTPVLNQRLAVVSMEGRGINIRYEDGRWEGWVSTQGAHGMRAKIARALGVEPEAVRIHVGDVGGGFGMKIMDHPEYALCALAAKDLGRPVKWVGERSESFLSDAQGRDMRGTVEGAFDADGTCLAMRMRTVSGIGAYYSTVGIAVHTAFSAGLLGGMYKIKAHHAHVRGAFVNTPPTDAYRGAGRPETIYATELLMDAAARQIGLDRVEIRQRNLVTPDMLPHPTPGGFSFDSLDTQKVTANTAQRADWARFEGQANGKLSGIGVAYYMERTGGGLNEMTKVTLTPEGGARIHIGTQSTGQGHETAWAQILHAQLGLPFEKIEVMPGDSDAIPMGGGTGGSRSAKMASRVILLAAEDIVTQGKALAAERLEAAEEDIEFDPAQARFTIAGTDRSVDLAALAEAAEIIGTGKVEGRESTFPNGCHIAEVEIDPETGQIALTRYTITDDFGTLINPDLVRGQVHGGVVQGIGQVLGEEMRWDAEGQPQTASFMDYHMPRADDLPMFDVDLVEVPAKTNPLGVKGCGEAGCCGGIPSTALAVMDALRRGGVTDLEAPFTPYRVWSALREAGHV
ncbi:MAG: xanthine dehydrogenase family protein molybdopterin-binding subunit [Pseudomonadota bacterium]